MIVDLLSLLIVLAVAGAGLREVWQKPKADEALIIPRGMGLKIVVGKRAFVPPGSAHRLSLGVRQMELAVEAVSSQGHPVKIVGRAVYQVGSDNASIENAARFFLASGEEHMRQALRSILGPHLRSLVGSTLLDRQRLADECLRSSGAQLSQLGLAVTSFAITSLEDQGAAAEAPEDPELPSAVLQPQPRARFSGLAQRALPSV